MTMKLSLASLAFAMLFVVLAGCQTANTPTEEATGLPETPVDAPTLEGALPTPTTTGQGAYPPPEPAATVGAYPPPTAAPSSDPYPVETPYNEAKRFTFDEPLEAGATEVSGRGYPNTPILIVSLSEASEQLGTGSTTADGTFTVSLSRSMNAREVLAVMLGAGASRDDFLDAPGTDIPTIGFVLVQAVVQ
jgi:hypothetical protein